jgi:hypothetical protein
MICAYEATLKQFATDCSERTIAAQVSKGFEARYGYLPSESERSSWTASLPAIAQAFTAARLEAGHIFVELQMPLTSARCDKSRGRKTRRLGNRIEAMESCLRIRDA